MKFGLRFTLLIFLLAIAGETFALGIGEANVRSYLNQPLEVEIPLLDVSAGEQENISARLASGSDYERVGLSEVTFSVPLSINLDFSGDSPRIFIRSSAPVRDPVVQILVDVNWSSGRILRQFTFFLDPPTFDLAPPPISQSSQPTVQPAPRPRASVPVSDQPSRPRALVEGEYGPVRSGETLWKITSDWLGDNGYSINQAMVAIVRLNPEAFNNGNMNQLRRGVILRMPADADMRSLSAAAANRIAADQTAAWRQNRPVTPPTIAESGTAPVSQSEPPATTQQSADTAVAEPARLQLVPPSEDASSRDGSSFAEDAAIAEMQERLARAEEELINTTQENDDLSVRVQALQEQLEQMRQGIAVDDTDLATLEQRLREQRLAEEGDAASEEAASLEELARQAAAESQADSTVDSTSQAESPTETAQTSTRLTTVSAPAEDPWWKKYLWWIIGALAVLLAIIGFPFLKSRFASEFEEPGDSGMADTLIASHETELPADEPPAPEKDVQTLTDDAEELLRVLEQEGDDIVDQPDVDLGDVAEELVEHAEGTSVVSKDFDPQTVEEFMEKTDSDEKPMEGVDELLEDVVPESDPDFDLGVITEDPDTGELMPDTDADADADEPIGENEVETKLDLAKAYLSMDDSEAARIILEEVLEEGDEKQQDEARNMLDDL